MLAPCSQAEALKEIFGDDDFMRRHKASVSGQKRRRLGTRLGADALKNLPALEKLAPPFRDGVHAVKARVLATVRPKAVGGVALSGTALLRLAEAYVDAINGGALPTIATAWGSVLTLECERASREALAALADGGVGARSRLPRGV